MSGDEGTPGVESWTPDDAMDRLAKALGGRVLRRGQRVSEPDEPAEPARQDWWSGDD
jgi:hypothetical protein